MRIITYNVNGVRAAVKKGFADWLRTDPADVICLQETKAHESDIPAEAIRDAGYDLFAFSAEKKGYSGVAVLTKIAPTNVVFGNGLQQSDAEGRVISVDIEDITIVNAYFPSGTSGADRQTYKYQWLDEFHNYLAQLRAKNPKQLVCGDYNICHKAIDIHDPVRNKNYTGFLPEERAWMDKFFDAGYVDTFRHFNTNPHQYTWWSAFANARANNKGWRIDYINATTPLTERLRKAEIMPEIKHSDHCPVFLELE
jgi:exodeoxyribonuclease III